MERPFASKRPIGPFFQTDANDISMPEPSVATHATTYRSLESIIKDKSLVPKTGGRVIGSYKIDGKFPINFSVGGNWSSAEVMLVYDLDYLASIGVTPVTYLTWGIDSPVLGSIKDNGALVEWWQRMPYASELKVNNQVPITDVDKIIVNINDTVFSARSPDSMSMEDLKSMLELTQRHGVDVVLRDEEPKTSIIGSANLFETEFSRWSQDIIEQGKDASEKIYGIKSFSSEEMGSSFPASGSLSTKVMAYNRFINRKMGLDIDESKNVANESMTDVKIDDTRRTLDTVIGKLREENPDFSREGQWMTAISWLEDKGWITVDRDRRTVDLLKWWA